MGREELARFPDFAANLRVFINFHCNYSAGKLVREITAAAKTHRRLIERLDYKTLTNALAGADDGKVLSEDKLNSTITFLLYYPVLDAKPNINFPLIHRIAKDMTTLPTGQFVERYATAPDITAAMPSKANAPVG